MVKIREPLKERCDKEIMAAKQKVVELSSKHAIEMEKMRTKLADARNRVGLLEGELAAREHEKRELRIEETLIDATAEAKRLLEQILSLYDGVDMAREDAVELAGAWEDVYERSKALEKERFALETSLEEMEGLLEEKESELKECLEDRDRAEKEHAERIRSLESSRCCIEALLFP